MGALISEAEQITEDWLTRLLQEKGQLDRGKVTVIEKKASRPFGSTVFQLEVSYSEDASKTAPSHLFLKMEQAGSLAKDREIVFYSSVASEMPDGPLVHCFEAVYEMESGAYHLLLEDLSKTHFMLEKEAPAPKQDIKRILAALAQFQAYWWDHPRLNVDLSRPVDEELIHGGDNSWFPGFVDFMGDRLSVERRKIYEKVLERLPELLKKRLVETKNRTLVHDDAHVWNFLMPNNSEKDKVYLVDWQQWGLSAGPHDVAYMITLFWYPERRQTMEKELIKHYHERLQAYGVSNYAWEACWYDYRLFTIRNLLVPLWAWANGHWWWHRWAQLEKSILAFQDLECAELLED